MAIGFRNSSSSISPGGIAGPSQSGSLVIVFDADFVGMSLLPSERDAILVVDLNAVTTGLIALQRLEPITGRDREIVESHRDVERLELSLRDSPNLVGNPPRRARISFAKQVRRSLVAKGLDHSAELHITRIACRHQSAPGPSEATRLGCSPNSRH